MKIRTLLVSLNILLFCLSHNSELRAQKLQCVLITSKTTINESKNTKQIEELAKGIAKRLELDFKCENFDFNELDPQCFPLDIILESTNVDKDDIVLLYYTGNGGRRHGDKSQSPTLLINGTNSVIFADSFSQAIINKGGRFNLFIYDTSNSYFDEIHPFEDYVNLHYTDKGSNYSFPNNPYGELFSSKGFVIINAASEGQNAFLNENGSLLVQALSKIINNGYKHNWEDIQKNLIDEVLKMSSGNQRPLVNIHLMK